MIYLFKNECTTMYIKQLVDSVNIQAVTFIEFCSGLTGKSFEMPTISYTERCIALSKALKKIKIEY